MMLTCVYLLVSFFGVSFAGFQCGRQNDNLRIVGGSETSKLQYPWMMRMTVIWNNGLASQCGASLIDSQWAITAAHCFNPPSPGAQLSRVQLVGGDHSVSQYEGTEDVLYGSTIVRHRGYNRQTQDNDITMVKLSRKLDYHGKDKVLQPICLSRSAMGAVDKNKCNTAGWGMTSDGGKSSDVLKHVTLPIQSDAKCRSVWGQYYNPSTKICAGGKANEDSCQGDSGGPLQCQMSNGAWVLTGIVSFGGVCGTEGQPGMYTRVEKYIDWIQQQRRDL